jgi:predicted transcriptional regulator
MDEKKTLEHAGLSKKQALVYESLLELGEAGMTDVAKHAGLKRPTAYLVVGELELTGLASMVVKGKKKIYSAAHPRRIAELLKFREHEFQEIFPMLVAKYGSLSGKPKVQMFEGAPAVRDAYRHIFSENRGRDEVLWFGDIGAVLQKFPELSKDYNRLLREFPHTKVRELAYGTLSAQWVDEQTRRKLKKNYRVKRLNAPGISFGLTDQCIAGDKVMLFSLSDELFMLVIEGAEIAKTYRGIFELLWSTHSS